MSYTYCKRCNLLFEMTGKPYCNDCKVTMDKEYEMILEYIKANPSAMVIDIIADTGVSLKTINILVEEGYVSYRNSEKEISNLELTRKLQKVINNGKFHLSDIG